MALVALALALLPGLLVVRAPWTVVAPLSLAFWTLSAWWPPFAGPGRGRLVAGALAASLLVALLRLVPKHEVAPPPGWQPRAAPASPARPGLAPPPLASAPSLVVLGTALALLAPLPLWHHAPGPRLAFQTTTARLIVWRDGIPVSYEPLLPLEPVGAHAPALATLAADAAQLTGSDPGPAELWVVAAAAGLLLVGLFALHATWVPAPAAALGALVALALVPWPGFLAAWGDGEALLALGFVLPAAALLLGHASRSSAVAAALLLAAGALAHPVLAGLGGLAVLVWLGCHGLLERPSRRAAGSLVLALVLAAPGLWPLARALSWREALAIASAGLRPLAPFALGLLLAGVAPLVVARLQERRRAAPQAAATDAGAALVAALLLLGHVHDWFGSGQLGQAARAALQRTASVEAPLEPVCAAEPERDFVPALAGRRAGEPGVWVPTVYSDEWARRDPVPCPTRLGE